MIKAYPAFTVIQLFNSKGKLTGVRRGFRIRDKETESPYLVHPLTYRQIYLAKDAYFGEKIHCVLVKNGLELPLYLKFLIAICPFYSSMH